MYINHVAYDNSRSSKNFSKGKFWNQSGANNDMSLSRGIDFVRFVIDNGLGEWPDWINNNTVPLLRKENQQNIVVTFINHSTFLVEARNYNLIFDPIFSRTAGPFSGIGVNRRREPGLELAKTPKIDYIFISHNHYDHLDLHALRFFNKRDNPIIFVPLGNKKWLTAKGISNVYEMDWWSNYEADDGSLFTFVPAQHFSGRTLFDRNKTLWGGFVIETLDMNIFHAGDTGYADHFKQISSKFEIDLAMLPIGDYYPEKLLNHVHMGPVDAIKAHLDLKSKCSFVMHCETFKLTPGHYMKPQNKLKDLLQTMSEVKNFEILEVGESRKFPFKKNES